MTVDPVWFGPRLKELREAAKLTQQALADRAGLTKAGISSLEQGRTQPHWATVIALCRALDVDCTVFMQAPAEEEPRPFGRPPKAKEELAPPAAKPKRQQGRKGKK